MEFEKIAFISDFLSEFTEELNSLENEIFDLRRNQSDKRALDSVIIHIQKLRSISTMMEFLRFENITSKLEKLFENIKDGRYKLANDVVRLFITISEELRNALENIENGQSDDIKNYDFIELNLQKAIDGEPFDSELNEYVRESVQNNNNSMAEKSQLVHVSIDKINEVLQNFDKLIMREFRLKKLLYEIFDENESLFAQKNSRKIRQIKETVELIENQSYSIHPVLHPLAVTPAVGAEQSDLPAGELGLAGVEHGLELVLLQDLIAHSGAAEGDGVELVHHVCAELSGGVHGDVQALLLCAIGDGVGHILGVSGAAEVNNCNLAHSNNNLSFIEF